MQKEPSRHAKKYSKSLDDLHGEFYHWFSDFEKIDKTLQLVSCPLPQDPETAPQELQLELIDLQPDSILKERFNSVQRDDFYASLSEATVFKHSEDGTEDAGVVWPTCVCEQAFSVMNINKGRHRSQLTDEHLRICPENCHNQTDTRL